MDIFDSQTWLASGMLNHHYFGLNSVNLREMKKKIQVCLRYVTRAPSLLHRRRNRAIHSFLRKTIRHFLLPKLPDLTSLDYSLEHDLNHRDPETPRNH
jgi:hypothetical protein